MWETLALVCVAAALATFFTSKTSASPGPDDLPVRREVLPNGLTLLVHESRGSGVACLYLFVRAGSRFESPGQTGIAHLFEHLMFAGSERFGADQYDRILEGNGGESNAYTMHDLTVYHSHFPPTLLPTVLEMELDRLTGLVITEERLRTEVRVILEEQRAERDDPYARMLEALYQTAFRVHPYRNPVIGRREDLERISVADVAAHAERFYTPGNLLLVIAGDLEPDRVLREVERTFGRLHRDTPPPPTPAAEPAQGAERRARVTMQCEHPAFLVGYPAPGIGHPDVLPLGALESVLAEGRSSRLHQRLIEGDELALDLDVELDQCVDPSLFVVYLEAREGVEPARLLEGFGEQGEILATEGPRDEEMEKFRHMALVDHLRSLATVSDRAELLGTYELLCGGYAELFRVPERLVRVTRDDVQRVARGYLDRARRTVVELVPLADEGAGS